MMLPFFVLNDKRGFSLLEMLIVVAMISILTVVAATSIQSNLPQYRLSGAARRVLTDLMLARMEAVSKNVDKSVTFTTTGYLGGVAADISSEFKGVALSTGNITFKATGMTSGPLTITLSSAGLPNKNVDVSTAGRIRIR
jgi:type IV fimbrial biogenesis protein FimT